MGKTRVEKALDILQQEIVLWRAEGTGEVFADLPGMRFYPVGDPRFYQWGLRLVWERSGDGTVLRRDEWQTVVDNLRARVSDTTFPVFVRVGGVPGAVFWDLGKACRWCASPGTGGIWWISLRNSRCASSVRRTCTLCLYLMRMRNRKMSFSYGSF